MNISDGVPEGAGRPLGRLAPVLWVLLALLVGCGRSDANPVSTKAAGATAAAPPPPTSYRIAPGHPRILLADAPTRERLKLVLEGSSSASSRFRAQVDGELMGRRAYAFQPWYSALIFQLTGDDRYASYAIEETEKFVAAEEAKIAGGQKPSVAGDSYLEIGQQVGNLALVYDWCHAKLSDEQRRRWTAYANQAVGNVWNHPQARWGNTVFAWTGWSVDNPSNNYYYSFLRATMLLGLATQGENPQAQRWIEQFRNTKIEQQLVPTFNRELQGGGSREGTGYGTAMKNLFQLYDWWERSTGERIATRTPHTLASMAHLMHSIVPTLDRLAPTGDHARDSTAALFDYHREYLLVLMTLFPQERLSGIARTLLENSSVPQMKSGFMFYADFMYEQPNLQARKLDELSTAYYGSGTGQVMMRSSWDKSATFANFICGPYTESHAHRDQGSFVIFNGDWLALDANLYSRSGIEQEENLHNLVRFETPAGPAKQAYGTSCTLAALAERPHYTYVSARMTPVYKGHAAVKRSEREFLFIKPDTFVVLDRAEAAGAKPVWTLNLPAAPVIEDNLIRINPGRSSLEVRRLLPAVAEVTVTAWPSTGRNFSAGARVDVSAAQAGSFLHVLSVNGALKSAVREDQQGKLGARLTFADGRSALVRFPAQGTGGEFELRGPDQAVLAQGALPTSVMPPPLFAN